MSDVKVGELIGIDAKRDAIHMALAPVIARQILRPGDHIGLMPDSNEEVIAASRHCPAIGIVDPFLTENVQVGERFFMFLYQNSVTSLKHAWTHPSFKDDYTAEDAALDRKVFTAMAGLDKYGYVPLDDDGCSSC